MSEVFTINAQPRNDLGKGASRRLRRLEGLVPGIVYGSGKASTPISIVYRDLIKLLENESFYSHILTMNVGDAHEQVVLKDIQRHPAKDIPTHIDFLRIDDTHIIRMNVPLHFINEAQCKGVKTGGGVVDHQMTEVEVQCLPQNLPEYIEVDMADLNLGDAIHLSQLKLPSGVKITALQQGEDHDHTVAMIQATRAGADAASEGEEEGATTES
ncbi:MAG: 50S ribosomal protein L25/general stress protein Ctc [Gammaproteobacteria bacterium]